MSQSLMHRRQFMRLGSATLAAAAATGLVPNAVGAILGDDGENPLLSVGFAPAVEEGEAVRIGNAAHLRFADSDLASRGAMITVHGLQRAGDRPAGRSLTHLNALFTVGDKKIPFLAWSEHVSDAPSVRFRVAPSSELALSVARRRVQPAGEYVESREIPAHELSEDGKSLCLAKLRRGTYYLALGSRWDRKPHWASLQADPATRTLSRGGVPAGFDYLIVSVDRV